PPVATVAVALDSTTVTAGSLAQATATLRDALNNVLTGRVTTWSSSNTAVATVNASGAISTLSAGSTTITATSETQTGSATLTVTASSVNIVFSDNFESGDLSKIQNGVRWTGNVFVDVATTNAFRGTH